MTTVTIEEAQAKLRELIEHLAPGEQVVITRDAKPVARLLAEARPKVNQRQPGSAKGQLTIVSDDDDHLSDFSDYMQ